MPERPATGSRWMAGSRRQPVVALAALLDEASLAWFEAMCPGKRHQFVAAYLVNRWPRTPSGRGRVTSRAFDQRLKVNRDRKAVNPEETDHATD